MIIPTPIVQGVKALSVTSSKLWKTVGELLLLELVFAMFCGLTDQDEESKQPERPLDSNTDYF